MDVTSSTQLLGGDATVRKDTIPAPVASNEQLFFDSSQSPKMRVIHTLFVGSVLLMVVISVFLSIYRAATVDHGGATYFFLCLSLVGFVVVEVFLVLFVRHSDLPKEKSWFLYFVGGCILLEALFIDILLFD